MMPIYRILTVVCLVLVVAAPVVAGKTLNLDQCIEYALEKNERVISARNSARVAGAGVWSAFGAFLPSGGISLSSSETHSNKEFAIIEGIPQAVEESGISKGYSIGGSASLTAFNGGKNIFDYSSARSAKKAADRMVEATELEIIYNVKRFYFAYLSALKALNVAEEAVKLGEEQYKLASSRYEVGSASKSDVLKAQVQLGTDRYDFITAENMVKSARAELAYYIGVDVNADVDFSTEYDSEVYDGSEADAVKYGFTNHPGLLAAGHNISSAKNQVRSAYGNYLPTLTLSIGKSWQNTFWSEVSQFNNIDATWNFGVRLSLSIFEGFWRKRAVTGAKADLNNARASYYYSKNAIAFEIKRAYLDLKKAREALVVAEETVNAAQEDMDLVQEKYNLGAATILELLDAQVNLTQARNQRIEADFGHNMAVASLEYAMGTR